MKRLFILLSLLTIETQAIIPAKAFKDITKDFKDPHYSPLMGRIALDSGLIYNLRHFGPFEPIYKDNPDGTRRREYALDKPNDKTMELLLKFFPSSAGPLASESTHPENYGKKAIIQDIANMLKFAKETRLLLITDSLITAKKLNNQQKLSHDREYSVLLQKYQDLGEFRTLIEQSIRLEGSPQSFDVLYPLYTTEQIILAFFVHKFSTKNDIFELMKLLGEDFVKVRSQRDIDLDYQNRYSRYDEIDRVENIQSNDVWDVDELKNYSNEQDLDYLYAATYIDFNAPIPFVNKLNPISNGNCPYIKKAGETKITDTSHFFADCNETAMRHLFTIGFYDVTSRSFKIGEAINNHDLKNFFKDLSSNTQDGSSSMRGRWNLVTSHLKGVRYVKDGNEISAGFINLIKAMREILGIKDQPLPTNENEVSEALKSLFIFMNPVLESSNIVITLSEFQSRKDGFKRTDDEFYGNAEFKIENSQGKKFSFILHEQLNHSEIRNPNWQQTNTQPPEPEKQSDPILSLVDKRLGREDLYKLLAAQEFSDERQRIVRVKDFQKDVQQKYIPIINRMMDLEVNDNTNMREAAEVIQFIVKKGFFFDSAFDIASKYTENDNLWNDFMHNQNAEFLSRLKNKGKANLNTKRLNDVKDIIKDLKAISLFEPNSINNLDLSTATSLEEFSTTSTTKIKSLTLPQLPRLKKVELNGMIRDLNLSAVTSLEEFSTTSSTKIMELTLPPSPNLKKLELNGEIDTANLSAATSLEEFSINKNTKISDLTLTKLPNLRKISIHDTIEKASIDLSASPIEEFSTNQDSVLREFTKFTKNQIENLRKVHLDGKIADVDLRGAINLEEFSTGPNANIQKLMLRGIPKLSIVKLEGKIENADLSNAIFLNKFSTGPNANISSLTLPNSQDLKVDLSGIIETADLSNAKNLDVFSTGSNVTIGKLILPYITKAKKISFDGKIETLDLRSAIYLEEFSIGPNATIGKLNLPYSQNLKKVHLDGVFNAVRLKHLRNLEELSTCSNTKIQNLTLPHSPYLIKINLYGTINTVDLSAAPNLQEFSTSYNTKIENLILPSSPKFTKIRFNGNVNIRDLNLSAASDLQEFSTSNNTTVENLVLPPSLYLKALYLAGSIGTADLSAATSLKEFSTDSETNIKKLFLPNSKDLKKVRIDGKIDMVDLRAVHNLKEFSTGYKSIISTLLFPNPTYLEKVELNGTIGTVNLSNAFNLKESSTGSDAKIENLTLPDSPYLKITED